MEQAVVQWGPAGFILITMLGSLVAIVKWFMNHIDTLTTNSNELIQEHLAHTNLVLAENTEVIKEIKQVIKNCNSRRR